MSCAQTAMALTMTKIAIAQICFSRRPENLFMCLSPDLKFRDLIPQEGLIMRGGKEKVCVQFEGTRAYCDSDQRKGQCQSFKLHHYQRKAAPLSGSAAPLESGIFL